MDNQEDNPHWEEEQEIKKRLKELGYLDEEDSM